MLFNFRRALSNSKIKSKQNELSNTNINMLKDIDFLVILTKAKSVKILPGIFTGHLALALEGSLKIDYNTFHCAYFIISSVHRTEFLTGEKPTFLFSQ